MMNKLIIVMGAPGAGKTTWCRHYLKTHKAEYISRDEIRFILVKENEPYFSKEKQVYKEFIKKIDNALFQNKTVIADQTSLNKAARAKLINSLKNKPNEIIAVYLKNSLETILEQNAKRTGRSRVPEDSVINMFNSIEKPTRDEGIDLYIEVTFENGKYKYTYAI